MAKVERIIKTTVKVELSQHEASLLMEILQQHPFLLDSSENESDDSKGLREQLLEEIREAIV